MVSPEVLEQNWRQLRSKIRPRWMALSEEDVARIDGNADMLIELLREKYGYTEVQAEAEAERFLRENVGAVPATPT